MSCVTKGSSTGMLLGVACASATFVRAARLEQALTAVLAVPSSGGAHSRCCLDAKMTLLTSPSASSWYTSLKTPCSSMHTGVRFCI